MLQRKTRVGSSVWVLVATIIGSSLVFIDGTVVALALPSMQRTFNASASDVLWIVEGYALVLGALMLFGGALGDRIGRRRVFQWGVIIFAAGSLGCALSQSLLQILAFRVLQGLGGMLLVPGSLAIIGSHFTGAARDRAIGTWSAFSALTSSVGPALGGVLIDKFGWRSIFYVNLPLALVVLFATWWCVEESRDEEVSGPLDVVGSLLVTTGLGALTYALIAGQTYGWTNLRILSAIVLGVAALIGFVVTEMRVRSPILPLELFKSRAFTGVNIATLLLYGALAAILYELPFVMIQVHGYSATQTGLAILPAIVSIVLLSRFGASLALFWGRRFSLTIGPTIAGAGMLLLGLLERNPSYWMSFFPGLLLFGIGMGLTVAPLTATVVDSVTPRHMGTASGVNNAMSRVAGLIAIAALGAIVWVGFNARLDRELAGMSATTTQRAMADSHRKDMAAARLPDPQLHVAFIESFRGGFAILAFSCGALALLAAATDFLTMGEVRASKVGTTQGRVT